MINITGREIFVDYIGRDGMLRGRKALKVKSVFGLEQTEYHTTTVGGDTETRAAIQVDASDMMFGLEEPIGGSIKDQSLVQIEVEWERQGRIDPNVIRTGRAITGLSHVRFHDDDDWQYIIDLFLTNSLQAG